MNKWLTIILVETMFLLLGDLDFSHSSWVEFIFGSGYWLLFAILLSLNLLIVQLEFELRRVTYFYPFILVGSWWLSRPSINLFWTDDVSSFYWLKLYPTRGLISLMILVIGEVFIWVWFHREGERV